MKKNNINVYSALDIGCSTGLFLGKYVDARKKVGIDISRQAIERAAERFPDAIFKVYQDDDDLEHLVNRKCFDQISILDVLEHLFDPEGTIQILKQLLNPNGYIIASVPNDLCRIERKLKLLVTPKFLLDLNAEHIRFFSKESLEQLLVRNGFRIIASKSYNRNPIKSLLNPLLPNLVGFGFIVIGQKK